MSARSIRVFQVATGNLGTEMIKRIGQHPDLELVGLHCYTPEKIGRDAGEIVGIDPIGVTATGTVEEIVAAKPDVLTFHGVFPDEDLYIKVLEAARLVRRSVQGRTHTCYLNPEPLGAVREWMQFYERFWNRRLDALADAMAADLGPEAGDASESRLSTHPNPPSRNEP